MKEGDVIVLTMGARRLRVQVESVQETVAKNDAAMLYRILSDDGI